MNSSLEKRKRRIVGNPAKIKEEKKEEEPRHFSSIAVKTFSNKAGKPAIQFTSASPVLARQNNTSLFSDKNVKPLTSKIGAKILNKDECSTKPRPRSISPPKSIKRTQSMSKMGSVHQTSSAHQTAKTSNIKTSSVHQTAKTSNLPKPIYPRQSTGDKPIRPRVITDQGASPDRPLSRSPSAPSRPISASPSTNSPSRLSPIKPVSPSNSTSSLGSFLSQDSYSFEIARLSSPTVLSRSSSCGTMPVLPSQRIKTFMASSGYLYGKSTGVIKSSRQKVKSGGMKPLKEKIEPHLKYGIGFSDGLKKSRSVGRFGYGLRKSPSGFSEVASLCSLGSDMVG